MLRLPALKFRKAGDGYKRPRKSATETVKRQHKMWLRKKAQEYLPSVKASKHFQSDRLDELQRMQRMGIHNPEKADIVNTAIATLRSRTGRSIWNDLQRGTSPFRPS